MFFAIERFLLYFGLIDFLIYVPEISKIKFLEISRLIYVWEISEIKFSEIS